VIFRLRGPKWLRSDQYDIAAKVTSSPDNDIAAQGKEGELTDEERRASGERLRAVVQSLLAERF
jgi:uncharacterized protein (TIGR03435 family)